jgi:hypothetical protein
VHCGQAFKVAHDCHVLTGGTRQDSGSSSGPRDTYLVAEEGTAVAGRANPDEGEFPINMVPLVFVAAVRYKSFTGPPPVFIPLLNQLSDEWRRHEVTGCSMLVAKLFLMKHIMGRETVWLSELLGSIDLAIDLGSNNFLVDIPDGNFNLHHLDKHVLVHMAILQVHLKDGLFQLLVDRLEESGQWAFVGPKNYGPDSWLLLVEHGSGRLRMLHLQSKARSNPEAFNEAGLQAESAKRWEVSEPDSLMLYVTDQHAPKRCRAQLSILHKPVVIRSADLDKYYSYCMSFIKASVAKHGSMCKVAVL